MPARIIAVILVKPGMCHRPSGRCTITQRDVARLSLAHLPPVGYSSSVCLQPVFDTDDFNVAERRLHQLQPCGQGATVYASRGPVATIAQGFIFTKKGSQYVEDTSSHYSAVQIIAVAPARRADSRHQPTNFHDFAIENEGLITDAMIAYKPDRAHLED
jgi:hypothetical protein